MSGQQAGRRRAWQAPGRVNLIGDHTDYSDGFALPFAISRQVTAMVAEITEPVVRISSTACAPPVQVPLAGLEPGAVTGWAAYPAGVVWAIVSSGASPPSGGVVIDLDGDVPIGAGLSSSAAVTCATAGALGDLWGLQLTRSKMVELARRAENEFVGAPTGAMDQMAVLHSRAGHALLFDARAMTAEHLRISLSEQRLAFLVIDTRQPHGHVEGGYAERRGACLAAARRLGVPALRDVSVSDLPAAMDRLGDPMLAAAARHVVTENARVRDAAAVLRAGDARALGPLLNASHVSLRDALRVSTDALDLAARTACQAGAIGSRMTGGGFGGCAIALADRSRLPAIQAAVTAAFARSGLQPPGTWTESPQRGARAIPALQAEVPQS